MVNNNNNNNNNNNYNNNKTVKNNNTGTNEVQMVLNRISSVMKDVIFNILCVWRWSLLYNCCVSVIQFTIVVDPAESVAR